jgi:flagellar M-ring protein FliF
MPDWRHYIRQARRLAARVPTIGWLIGGAIAASIAVVTALEMGGPAYAALYEGLSPAQGGKVIGELQKLGIPYQLQAAGDVIMVPAPDLAEARLELGAAEIPGDDVSNGWDKLENAPMTTSDLAQNVMATQALEASLEQSIEQMEGVHAAQVYLATPPDTAFLADQPKPTASVVIDADAEDAQAQAKAIASLVAGAVPGLSTDQVNVATTSGIVVNPSDKSLNTASQLATLDQVQNAAAMRIAQLLTPIVGAGNFRTSVSANIDFTQEHLQQLTYGPDPVVSHESSTDSEQTGTLNAAMGIPGALSNEPPAATSATPPQNPSAGAGAEEAAAGADTGNGVPHQSSKNTEQTFVVSQTQSDITKPDWVVDSIAISVVLNKAALGPVTTDQVKAALAGAFAYPSVNVNVMAAPFRSAAGVADAASLLLAAGPVAHAVMEIVAVLALLFGAVLPMSRWLGRLNVGVTHTALPRPVEIAVPKKEFGKLRNLAAEEPIAVAKLLQSWAEADG